jgi:hypothetical protein
LSSTGWMSQRFSVTLTNPATNEAYLSGYAEPRSGSARCSHSHPLVKCSSSASQDLVYRPGMNDAWIAFAGVALGALFGLVPTVLNRRDLKIQQQAADAREEREEAARLRSLQASVLLKCAHTSNDFLAAWALARQTRPLANDDADVTIEHLRQSYECAARMKSAWTEALVLVADDNRQDTIRAMLREANEVSLSEANEISQLDELASITRRGLDGLIGAEPAQ